MCIVIMTMGNNNNEITSNSPSFLSFILQRREILPNIIILIN